jgi:hypothetical protein
MKKKVTVPGSSADHEKKTKLKNLSVSGGVVNAYKAVQLAMKKTGN